MDEEISMENLTPLCSPLLGITMNFSTLYTTIR
jgi:hypothetical protein